ncbi:MAG: hypothetical protein J1E43_04125 [Christensenellaceae bacterium]|nr:hypothetical protein [Christensenellaceae bacterium]
MKKKNLSIRSGLFGALLAALAACYMPLFMYFSNADEVSITEILPLIGAFAGAALLLYAILLLFARSAWKASLTAAIGALIATNYLYIEKVFMLLPVHLRYWHVVALVAFIYVHLAYFIIKVLKDDPAQTAGQVLLIVLAGLLVVNLAGAVPAIVENVSVARQNRAVNEESEDQTASAMDLPNIYYFIFDEFSSKATMEKCYGFSNDSFFHALEDLGFTVSYNSRNMSFATITVTANYMNLDYVVTDQDSSQMRLAVKADNATKPLMQQHGYELRFIGAGSSVVDWGIADNMIESVTSTSTTVGGKTIQDLILERTIMYPTVDIEGSGAKLAGQINTVFDYFNDPNHYDRAGNTYTFAYFESPHEPFIFSADGTLNNPRYFYEWENPQFYLNQYQYMSGRIVEAVRSIIANDPDAIIILQSDHSARWASFISPEDKVSILNAVYYGGEAMGEILGKSGVNTLRTVYGRLFGLDMPDVEVVE